MDGRGGWTTSHKWLVGEPCTDGWFGVVCCPEEYAKYRREGGVWQCQRSDDDDDPGSSAVGLDLAPRSPAGWPNGAGALPWPNGCASGSSSGTEADRARCVVVAIELEDNNLEGELPARLCELAPHLQRLDVSGNKLRGALPPCVAGDTYDLVDLSDNEFGYYESSPTLRSLISRCRTSPDLACSGVPPQSCSSFGDDYVVRSDDSERCVRCPDATLGVLLQVAVLLVFALLIVAYASTPLFQVVVPLPVGAYAPSSHRRYVRLVAHFQRLGEKLDLWINTAAIFFCHLQTLSIIGTLKLAWPPSVEAITEIASVDFLSLGSVRPECTLRLGDNSFYIITIFRLGILIVLVLGVGFAQSAVKTCAPARSLQQTVRARPNAHGPLHTAPCTRPHNRPNRCRCAPSTSSRWSRRCSSRLG